MANWLVWNIEIILPDLIDPAGNRLYLTAAERATFLVAAEKAECNGRSFCEVLYFTSSRILKALALTVARVNLGGQALVFEAFKKRGSSVYGAIPISPRLNDTLVLVHGVKEAHGHRRDRLLRPWSRTMAWRNVKAVMAAVRIEGPKATARACAMTTVSRRLAQRCH